MAILRRLAGAPALSPALLALSPGAPLGVGLAALADRYTPKDFGLHGASPQRLAVATAMGLGVVVVCAFWSYRRIFMGGADLSADHVVFALTFSVLGSATPEELLFRGLRWMPGAEMPAGVWAEWVLGTVLPLGLWWGLMRDLAGGSLWPGLLSHALIEFGTRLAGSPICGKPASF